MKTMLIAGAVLLVLLGLIVAQEGRYLRARRDAAHDRQPLFHGPSTFHAATVVRLAPGRPLLDDARVLVRAIEAEGGQIVYAGEVVVNGIASDQLPAAEWDAFVLAQYPSREAFDRAVRSPGLEEALASFTDRYTLGMIRSAALNLGIPIGLGALRVWDVLRREPARYPFTRMELPPDAPADARERRDRLVEALLAHPQTGRDAVVVLNFIQNGSEAERKANTGYGLKLMSLMAELGHGPIHLGRAVTVEGDARFDQVAIVYYPGVQYFADMVRSEFFTGIVGGKQLEDTLSSVTVPLLPRL
jgi:hypothetical protein